MKSVIDHHFENIKYTTLTSLKMAHFTGFFIHFASENCCTGIYLNKAVARNGLKTEQECQIYEKASKKCLALSSELSMLFQGVCL